MSPMNRLFVAVVMLGITSLPAAVSADIVSCGDMPTSIQFHVGEWSKTDFSRCTVPLGELISGGPGKDGIPALDNPVAITVSEITGLDDHEPVISLSLNGAARAWPLRILIWHEIANDVLEGTPIAVTYCPLCNAAIVFDRRVEGKVLSFGTTGNLRRSDLVMYDRQTESWWQQYTGEAIIGDLAGTYLEPLPSRLESWSEFRTRHPEGTVLVPNNPNLRVYGANPYVGYDTSAFPFLYTGPLPQRIDALARVVVIDDQAWSLDLLRARKEIRSGNIRLSWTPGQKSALDTALIARGREVGTAIAQRLNNDAWEDIPYEVTFAFVYHAFTPDGVIITN